jgi:imidazolonepropionase-like amidohydrolase
MIPISTRLATVLLVTLLALVGFSPESPTAQAPAMALTGARVIDGTGAAPVEQATIVVANGRIESVGPAASAKIPAGATRVDMAGKTIVPGLINAHGHLNADTTSRPVRDKLASQLRVYADYGVTTVVVLGAGVDELDETVSLREAQANGPLDRARVYVAGNSIRNLKTAEEARAQVNRYADEKADIIKIHITGGPMDMTPEVYGALIEQAHKRGLRVAAHLYYIKDAKGLLDKGVDVIAHSIRDQPVDAATIAEMKRRNVPYIPTLTRDLAQFVYETTPPYFKDPFFLTHVDHYRREMNLLLDPAMQAKTRNDKARQAIKPALEMANRNLKTLQDAGVTIAMGTDSGPAGRFMGYFELMELELMTKAGLTAKQVLQAATRDAARCQKIDADLGTLEVKKWADFVVLDADPLANISNTRQIADVYIAGNRVAR